MLCCGRRHIFYIFVRFSWIRNKYWPKKHKSRNKKIAKHCVSATPYYFYAHEKKHKKCTREFFIHIHMQHNYTNETIPKCNEHILHFRNLTTTYITANNDNNNKFSSEQKIFLFNNKKRERETNDIHSRQLCCWYDRDYSLNYLKNIFFVNYWFFYVSFSLCRSLYLHSWHITRQIQNYSSMQRTYNGVHIIINVRLVIAVISTFFRFLYVLCVQYGN